MLHLHIPGHHTAHQSSVDLGRGFVFEQGFPALGQERAVGAGDLDEGVH
jgi:hypothetical protein